MPMTIRFIKNYGSHKFKAGDVRVVEDAHAADFIERGFAVEETPEPEPIQEVAPPPVLGVAPDEVEDN